MYWKGIARTGDERKKQWPLRLNPGSAQEMPTGGLNWRFHGSLSVERGVANVLLRTMNRMLRDQHITIIRTELTRPGWLRNDQLNKTTVTARAFLTVFFSLYRASAQIRSSACRRVGCRWICGRILRALSRHPVATQTWRRRRRWVCRQRLAPAGCRAPSDEHSASTHQHCLLVPSSASHGGTNQTDLNNEQLRNR